VTVAEMTRDRERLQLLVLQREKREWHV
jgi:hypothetical protein